MTTKYSRLSIRQLEECGAILDIQDGNHGERHPKAADYVETGIPFIMANNIRDGFIDLDSCQCITEDQARSLQIGFSNVGDVLLSHKGTLGNVALVTTADPFLMLTPQVTYYRTDNTKLLNRFLVYAFRDPSFQARMRSGADQGTRPYIGITAQRRLEILYPPIVTQRRIADILSAYDDLIENNRRRMVLLEEAARQIYREWFVRLLFPGHEHTRIANGVPEGWEHQLLAKACLPENGIQTGPFGSQLHQSDYTEEGVPVVMPKDIINSRVTVDNIARIPESLADSLGRHRMQEGDVVYGRRGDIGRRGFISRRQVGWFCGTGSLRLRPNQDVVVPRYFFEALGAPDTAGTIAARAKGATMPNLNATIMASVPLLVPPHTLQRQYAENVEPMFEMVETLADQNHKLRAARDLLLPRLMSGEITI